MPPIAAEPLLDLRSGWVDDRLVDDEALYDIELERIFAEDWTLVAHEQQLPNVGDYLTTHVGEDPLLVVRQTDGRVAAFLNSCRHRGFQVCRSQTGNADHFVCGNHGWTYAASGELQTIGDRPAEPLVGPGIGLVPVPYVTVRDGWIMVSWSEAAPVGSPWHALEGETPAPDAPDRVWLPINWKTAAIRLRSLIGEPPESTLLGGPYISTANRTVHTLRPSGTDRTELTTWRLLGAADAADALAASLAASDLQLDALPEVSETRVSLRREAAPPPVVEHDHDHDHADACGPPAAPRKMIRRRLEDATATGVYAAWIARLDASTRQRLGVVGAEGGGVP